MANLKSKGEHGVACDSCETEEWAGVMDFREFIAYIQRTLGWLVKPDGDEWKHYCPDCQE